MTALMRWLLPLLLLCTGGAAQAQTFPKFTGLVVDDANVLSPAVEADLTAKLEALQKDTKRQLVVATIGDAQGYPLEEYGYRLLRAWGVGLKDVNNGAILFLAPNNPAGQRGPRLEVGYGLEPILTDALSSQIIREQMLPRLKANGDVGGAITAGTDAIVAQLRASPEEQQARADASIVAFDKANKRSTRSSSSGIPVGLIFWGVLLAFFVLPAIFRGKGGRGRRYRGGGDGGALPIVLWSIANELSRGSGGGSSWGGGGGSSWGSGGSDGSWGGGGFTGGGGGSGGGGGASGDW